MKNVRLINRGIPRLYEADTGRPIEAFNAYSDLLFNDLYHSNGASTPRIYCPDVAEFFDYGYETGILGANCLSPEAADATMRQYHNYLTEGTQSKNFVIRRAAIALNHRAVSAAFGARKVAAVNHFLHNGTRVSQDTTSHRSILAGERPLPILTPSVITPKLRGRAERSRIFEQTLQYGAPRTDFAFARGGIPGPKVKRINAKRDFPTCHILSLLRNAPSSFYRCLWALQAGGGLRISEAFLIQRNNIHTTNKTIRIEDPNNRRDPSKKNDGSRIAYKGRQTASIIMFEPYKSIFFEALEQYETERPSSSSDYLFVSEKRESYGEAIVQSGLFNTITKTYNAELKTAQKAAGLVNTCQKVFTSHSLRHFYGNWARNCVHIPGRNRIGLELSEIQLLMGHKDIKSTERYAQLDEVNVAVEIAAANQLVHGWSSSYSADLVRAQTYARLADELLARAA
ncbi:site-specific integrase [Pseudomonas sp. MH10]|uniref:tyrosine-type recombinase/integrase n=1 Tax=Pseudomonas sp. MH10 TaxID=3048627 RepID=UPI002AC95840|nr:site-specific integrase [Pseudomonas sp. MH10]MEB0043592.1 site-specific integrase [Pseudomonas sp. MH10]WPX63594.1 site-specific integrase [Pseudomonas sp. MH10]